MNAPDVLDLYGVAAELGAHYDTVRKRWRGWATPGHPDFRHFPWPFEATTPPRRHAPIRWRASAIREWKLARERALGAGCSAPQPRVEPQHQAHDVARREHRTLQRQRAALAQLMERA